MAAVSPVTVTLTPDVRCLHALAALVEKHAGAFRADLEKMMAGELDGEPEPAGGV